MQKSEVIKYLAKIEMPEPEREATPEFAPSSPLHQRFSNDVESATPREHSFVRTMFAKRECAILLSNGLVFSQHVSLPAVICRVCHLEVKRSAVLCSQCSLIAHSKCASNARPVCDILSQLLLYAQYAEGGTPGSPAAINPLDAFGPLMGPGTPSTPISEAGVSARTSIEGSSNASSPPLSSSPPVHPPSAFKALGGAFKRSRSFLNGDLSSQTSSNAANPPPPSQPMRQLSRKMSILSRRHYAAPLPSVTTASERPSSIASSSASPQSPSLRSGTTTTTTTSNSRARPDTVRRQSTTISIVETDISVGDRTDRDRRLSRRTSGSFSATSMSVVHPDDIQSIDLPGDFSGAGHAATTRKRDGGKNDKSGCLVQ
jgi:hypothetical protein